MSAEPSTEILHGRLDCCVSVSDVATRQHYAPPVDITWLCRDTDEAHSVAGPSLLERTGRRSPQPIAQCRWLPANVKDSVGHHMEQSSWISDSRHAYLGLHLVHEKTI